MLFFGMPDIRAFFESEEGNEFEKWKQEQSRLKAQKAYKSA